MFINSPDWGYKRESMCLFNVLCKFRPLEHPLALSLPKIGFVLAGVADSIRRTITIVYCFRKCSLLSAQCARIISIIRGGIIIKVCGKYTNSCSYRIKQRRHRNNSALLNLFCKNLGEIVLEVHNNNNNNNMFSQLCQLP